MAVLLDENPFESFLEEMPDPAIALVVGLGVTPLSCLMPLDRFPFGVSTTR
jgi:hypothetical protein